jgi:hypothetical protein
MIFRGWCACRLLAAVTALAVCAPALAQSSGEEPGAVGDESAAGAPAAARIARPAEGLARLTPDWPSWLTVTLVDRVRVESSRAPNAPGADYDTYLLNRFRLTAAARMSAWARATVQLQDSHVAGYDGSPVPRSIGNPIDLRLANVELGRGGPSGVSAVVGRQELNMGDRRLVASPDWTNVGRTYDGLHAAAWVPGFRIDAFGVAPVDVSRPGFSRAKYGERLFGVWATFDRVRPLAYLDVYQLLKRNASATGETGSTGDQMVYTTGVRAGAPIGSSVRVETEVAIQRGHSAADRISAWATHDGVRWTMARRAWQPTLGAEYNFASGDRHPNDGVRQTFDQLYASWHDRWGLADQVGWKNMRHAAVTLALRPAASLEVNAAVNTLALATVRDAWYSVTGAKVVTNPRATSRDLGWSPDVWASWTVSRDLSVGAGLAVLMCGTFIRESIGLDRLWVPYVMSTVKF